MKEVYIDCGITQSRAALFEDGAITDIFIENSDDINISGNIYKCRVENIVAALGAAFVNIGSDKNAMLHFDKKEELFKIKRGDSILVQVIREPSSDKGARVTTQIAITGRYIVLVPNSSGINVSRKINSEDTRVDLAGRISKIIDEGYGIIVRTESETADFNDIENEYIVLKNIWNDISEHSGYLKAPSIVYDSRNIYSYLSREFIKGDVEKVYINRQQDAGYLRKILSLYNKAAQVVCDESIIHPYDMIDNQITLLLQKKVDLPSGGFIYVEKTEAMTVFDVNSGSFTNSVSKEETILKTNIEAGLMIAQIIGLCNFSGIIIIDFIDMLPSKNKEILLKELSDAFKKDRLPVKVFGFTKLGLMEISRPRKGKTIYEALYRDYFLKQLSISYILKNIENSCIKYSRNKKMKEFTLNISHKALSENEEYIKYFKEQMNILYNISVNCICSENEQGIELCILV